MTSCKARSSVLRVALAVFAAGLLSHPPGADAQSRYNVSRMGDVVTLGPQSARVADESADDGLPW